MSITLDDDTPVEVNIAFFSVVSFKLEKLVQIR